MSSPSYQVSGGLSAFAPFLNSSDRPLLKSRSPAVGVCPNAHTLIRRKRARIDVPPSSSLPRFHIYTVGLSNPFRLRPSISPPLPACAGIYGVNAPLSTFDGYPPRDFLSAERKVDQRRRAPPISPPAHSFGLRHSSLPLSSNPNLCFVHVGDSGFLRLALDLSYLFLCARAQRVLFLRAFPQWCRGCTP